MIKIYCSKTFSKFFDLQVLPEKKQDISILNWSAHSYKIGKRQNLIFVNHLTFFYFVVFDVTKSNFINIEKLFLENLLKEIEKTNKLNLCDENLLIEKFKNLYFLEKSTNKDINYIIVNFVSLIKNFEVLDGITFDSFYAEEDVYNGDSAQRFITQILK